MRKGILAASVIAASATLGGCSAGAAHPYAGTGTASGSGSPHAVPTASAAWTANLTWSRTGIIQTGVPATPISGIQYQPPAGFGLVAVVGDEVVTADFTRPDNGDPTPVTVQFRDARSGAVTADIKLQTWDFGGIRADTVGGRPVAEVRYAPPSGQPGGSTDGSNFISVVYDTSGRRLWSSAGQQMSDYLKPGLMFASSGLISAGYLLRFNPGTNNWHQGGGYDVLDLTGKVVMAIPYHPVYYASWPSQSPINGVELIDGYAMVTHTHNPPATPPKSLVTTPTKPSSFDFVVYDLAHGGRQVADVVESFQSVNMNVYVNPGVLAGCDGRLLLSWDTGSMLAPADIQLSVLDLASGRTTTPVPVPVMLRAQLGTPLTSLTDAACTTALLHGSISGGQLTFAVDLAHGTVLWHTAQSDHDLSMRDGTIYALRSQSLPATRPGLPATPLPGRPISISATTGTARIDDTAAVPLAFTADGSAVFAAASDPAKCSPPPPPPPTPTARPSPPPLWTQQPPANCAITVWVAKP